MHNYEVWVKSARELREAKDWIELPGKRGNGGKPHRFALSPAHGSIKLVIAGQEYEGGKNYWDSPACLNGALLEAIRDNFELLMDSAVAIMEARVKQKLVACEEEVKAMQASIAEAKGDK